MFKKIYIFFSNSIYKKLIISVSIFILLPMGIMYSYTFSFYNKILVQNFTKQAMLTLSSISNNVNKTTDSMMTTAKIISSYSLVLSTLSNDTKDENILEILALDKYISSYKSNYLNDYFNISIIPTNGDILATWPIHYNDYSYFKKELWFISTLKKGGTYTWIAPQKQYIKYDTNKDEKFLVSVSTGIYNTYVSNTKGVVLVSLDESELYKMINSSDISAKDKDYLLIDSKGIIISHRDKNLIGINISTLNISNSIFNSSEGSSIVNIKDGDFLVNYITLKTTNWKLVELTPYSSVLYQVSSLANRIIIFTSILIIVIFCVIFLLSLKITAPIRKLAKLMKLVEYGKMDVAANETGHDEIQILGQAFNRMMAKQKLLIIQVTEEERKLAEAQRRKDEIKLEMLLAQINPHFMFNTLNTIKWTALMGATDTVAEMVSSLGNLLEMSINRGNEIITLEDEIKNVNSYIYIQKIRFNDMFTVHFEIPQNCLKCRVPKFILQPIVENSVNHGFQNLDYKGIITISANINCTLLILTITDNGVGMDKNTLLNILISDKGFIENKLNGIGICNVHERIKLYYGDEYGLRIESKMGIGTTLEIILPLNYGE